jgi:glycolate oxidase
MTKLAMPKIDRKLISKKIEVIADLKKIVKDENILGHEDQTRPFETDALSAYKQKPLAVVFPKNTNEVSKILTYCNQARIKVVPRGAGTGLSGGALPLEDSILLCLTKFNKIINIDYKNSCVVAQPGVTNLSITQAVEQPHIYFYNQY